MIPKRCNFSDRIMRRNKELALSEVLGPFDHAAKEPGQPLIELLPGGGCGLDHPGVDLRPRADLRYELAVQAAQRRKLRRGRNLLVADDGEDGSQSAASA